MEHEWNLHEENKKILPYLEATLADLKDTVYPTNTFDDKILFFEKLITCLKSGTELGDAVITFCKEIARIIDRQSAEKSLPEDCTESDSATNICNSITHSTVYEIYSLLNAYSESSNSRKESNLDRYGYDMVFASTLSSINTAMKQYVDIIIGNKAPVIRYFTKNKGSSEYIEITDENLLKELNQMKLFELSPEQANEQAKKLYSSPYKLRLAFQVQCGFPDNLVSFPDVIKFDVPNHQIQEGTTIYYNMYFKKLSLIEISVDVDDEGEINYLAKVYSQNPSKPAIIVNTVNLGLNGDISEEIRRRINNIDPSTIFSIQQLFADFNTIELSQTMKFDGISDSSSKYVAQEIFFTHKELLKNGRGVLCYSIAPSVNTQSKNYFAKPASFKFWISPFLTNHQPDTSNYKLWTLNYLVSCDPDKPINPQSLGWNWVEKNENQSVGGIMSISNSYMRNFSETIFTEFIRDLLITFTPSIKCSGFCTITTSYSGVHPSISPKFNENGQYNYDCDITASDSSWLSNKCSFQIKSTYTTDYRLYNNTTDGSTVLEYTVHPQIYVWLSDGLGSSASGDAYNNTIKFAVTVQVNANGQMKLNPTITAGKPTSNVKNAAMISGDFAGWITQYIGENLTSTIKYYSTYFTNKYSNYITWYLPGDDSLIFAAPTFSDKTDLTIQTQYAQPKNQTNN